ncbi:SLIT-ROBO Rho GTPase-activating protein [Dirofilaria immitis]
MIGVSNPTDAVNRTISWKGLVVIHWRIMDCGINSRAVETYRSICFYIIVTIAVTYFACISVLDKRERREETEKRMFVMCHYQLWLPRGSTNEFFIFIYGV